LNVVHAEFWKQVPPNEPYRVILGDVRDKLYYTRERSRHLLTTGISDIPEEATFTNVEQVLSFSVIYIFVIVDVILIII
jgi:phosphoenolpyruvate carboxylase